MPQRVNWKVSQCDLFITNKQLIAIILAPLQLTLHRIIAFNLNENSLITVNKFTLILTTCSNYKVDKDTVNKDDSEMLTKAFKFSE